MTATTTGPLHQQASDHRLVAAAAGLLAFGIAAFFTWHGANSDSEVVSMVGMEAVVCLVLFGWFVPTRMATGAPATALTLGIVSAVLTLPAFWSGLPLTLGVAGVLIGTSSHGRRAVAGLVLSGIAVAGYLFLYLVVDLVLGQL